VGFPGRVIVADHCVRSLGALRCLGEEAQEVELEAQEVELLVLGMMTATARCPRSAEISRCLRLSGVCESEVDLGSLANGSRDFHDYRPALSSAKTKTAIRLGRPRYGL